MEVYELPEKKVKITNTKMIDMLSKAVNKMRILTKK